MMPAPAGWEAIFFEDGRIEHVPLACLALIEVNEKKGEFGTYVVGLIPEDESAFMMVPDDIPSFLGLSYPGKTEDWEALAKKGKSQ